MIGILALQGAFQKHQDCLTKLSTPSKLIRHLEDLESCQGLIIPGGETTAHLKLLSKNFWEALLDFGKTKPIFGTCCGLILLSKEVVDSPVNTLGFINIKVARNAYGSQIDSFEDIVSTSLGHKTVNIEGCFIRAPKIVSVSETVSVLAYYQDVPVIVEEGLHLACAFHPEISMDLSLHRYFLEKCIGKKEVPLTALS